MPEVERRRKQKRRLYHLKVTYSRTGDESLFEEIKSLELNLLNSQPIISEISEDEIIRLCNSYGIKYHFAEGLLFLETTFSKWAVQQKSKSVKIFREKYIHTTNEESSVLKGYHVQDDPDVLQIKTTLQAVEYIYNHDRKKMMK